MVTQCPNYRVIDPVKHKLTLIIRETRVALKQMVVGIGEVDLCEL